MEECCEDGCSIDGALEWELGSEMRSESVMMASCGDLDGRDAKDICDADGDIGKEESEGLRGAGADGPCE